MLKHVKKVGRIKIFVYVSKILKSRRKVDRKMFLNNSGDVPRLV